MIKIYDDSEIAIWSCHEINDPARRVEADVNAEVIQCEPGECGDYIVEIRRGGSSQ